jgi:hypothetical protein
MPMEARGQFLAALLKDRFLTGEARFDFAGRTMEANRYSSSTTRTNVSDHGTLGIARPSRSA